MGIDRAQNRITGFIFNILLGYDVDFVGILHLAFTKPIRVTSLFLFSYYRMLWIYYIAGE